MYSVSGSPLGPFALAVFRVLNADATLASLAPGGVHTEPQQATEITSAYVAPGRRQMAAEGGTVTSDGHRVSVWLDVWSPASAPAEAQSILSRIRVLFQRRALSVDGFALVAGSVECRNELVFRDADPDMPDSQSWYHGVVEVTGLVHEAV